MGNAKSSRKFAPTPLTATELVEAGVDYITCTAPLGDMSVSLVNEAKFCLQDEAEAGNEVKKWRGLGYSGLACGAVSYGIGPQGSLVRLSSGVAQEKWQRVQRVSRNTSRIDLQVTVRLAESATQVVEECWKRVRAHWLAHPHLREPEVHCGPNGPHSISLGSRQSDRCGRIYDKGYESKLDHYADSVRFEGEFKGQVSRRLATAIAHANDPLAQIIPQVLGYFQKSMVELALFSYQPTSIEAPAKATDSVRRLRYLHNSIRPMVMSLMSQGFEREILEALGLSQQSDAWSNN